MEKVAYQEENPADIKAAEKMAKFFDKIRKDTPEFTSDNQKKRIEMYVFDVLDEREKHPEKTLAKLYDSEKMPDGLRQAHHNLDITIENASVPTHLLPTKNALSTFHPLRTNDPKKGTT